MPLQYVGGKAVSFAGTTSTTEISLLDITGGIDTQPRTDDFVLVMYSCSGAGRPPISVLTSGYLELANLYADSTRDTTASICCKFMGASPDTSVVLPATTSTTDPGSVIIRVWRGVNKAFPLDIPIAFSTFTTTQSVDPPAVTPLTNNTIIEVFGTAVGVSNFTLSNAGLQSFISVNGNSGRVIAAACGYASGSLNTYDPGTLNSVPSGTNTSIGITVVLRPAENIIILTPTDGIKDLAGYTEYRLSGASDLFDNGKAGVILTQDYFVAAASPPNPNLYLGVRTRSQLYLGIKSNEVLYLGIRNPF